MNDTDLKPCPFCGGKAEFVQSQRMYDFNTVVVCTVCRCNTVFDYFSLEEAMSKHPDNFNPEQGPREQWNQRVSTNATE